MTPFNLSTCKALAILSLSVLCMACGSGSGAGPTPPTQPGPTQPDPKQPDPKTPALSARIQLPSADGGLLQSRAFAVAEPAAGVMRVLNVDDKGHVMFASCDRACDTTRNWTLTALESNAVYKDSTPQLSIGADGQVHAMFDTPTGLNYWNCKANCTAADQWKKSTVLAGDGWGSRFSANGDWMALTPQGRPSFVVYNEEGVGRGGRYLLYTCGAGDCTASSAWKGTEVAQSRGSDSVFDLQWSGQSVHLVVGDYELETPGNVLTYFTCAQNCAEGGVWQHSPVHAWDGRSVGAPRTLSVLPTGDVLVAFTDEKKSEPQVAYRRAGQTGAWQIRSVLSLTGAANKWKTAGGSLDSRVVGGRYVLGTLGQLPGTTHATEALRLSCAACGGNDWTTETPLSTRADKWPDMDALFVYVYTALHWDVQLSDTGRMGLITTPTWLSDPGQLGDDTLADIKWLSVLTLTAEH